MGDPDDTDEVPVIYDPDEWRQADDDDPVEMDER
jgi:hypothetical protein